MRQRRSAWWVMTVAAVLALPACSANKQVASSGDSSVPGGSGQSSVYGQGYGDGSSAGDVSVGGSRDGNYAAGSENGVPNLSMAQGGTSSESRGLSGFERLAPGQTAREERLTEEPRYSRMLGGDAGDTLMAELRRQEEAAIAAGFKDAFFGYDQHSINGDTRDELSLNAEWIKAHPKAELKISGHCDERGTQDYNLVLGDKRAKSVKRYLVDLGVKAQQVSTISFGKNRPFCEEHDEACYKQNRRGHFLLSE
ncbi:MAG: OmpA family protein [Nitrospiraceae bacterium]